MLIPRNLNEGQPSRALGERTDRSLPVYAFPSATDDRSAR
jgi:hypothetical protein